MNRLKRVLVADNNPEAADTLALRMELSSRPVLAQAIYSGPRAVRLAREGYFDIIILSLQVTAHANLLAAQSIRLQKINKIIRLIVLSDHSEEVAALWEKPLFDHVLPKLVNLERLLDVIHHFKSHRI